MQVQYFKEYSDSLKRDMEFKVYGHAGKPALFFPSQDGRFYQYEDFGMIDACKNFVEDGRMQMFCVDSMDAESWSAEDKTPRERIACHEQYVKYILDDFLPLLRDVQGNKNEPGKELLFAGVSMGAAHAANFFFRFPVLGDALIALSGMYSTRPVLGDYMDSKVYFNSVADYLSNTDDPAALEKYRHSKIVICCGQGDYEDLMVTETLKIKEVLAAKDIPAWIDFWGKDVNHDWDWWRKQMPYFLGHVL